MAYYDSDDEGEGYDLEWLLPNPQRFWFEDNLLYPKERKKKETKNFMTDFTTEFMSGTIYWCKVFKAVPNYEKTGKEWTLNFIPDDDGIAILKKHRLLDRLKESNDSVPEDFLVLRKPELNKDGEKNDPIKVVDEDNEPWDKGNIGNGSKGDLRLTIADFGKGMKKAIWTNAIRVTEHVPHEGGTQSDDPFADYKSSPKTKTAKPSTEGNAKTKKAAKTVLEELDDDEIPF
jgi:hypothetical protein